MTTPFSFRKKYVKVPLDPQTFQSSSSHMQNDSTTSNGTNGSVDNDSSTGGFSTITSSTSSNGQSTIVENNKISDGDENMNGENHHDDDDNHDGTSVNVMDCLRTNMGVGETVSGAVTTVAMGGVNVIKEGGYIAKDVANATGRGMKKIANTGLNAVDQTTRGILRRPRSQDDNQNDIVGDTNNTSYEDASPTKENASLPKEIMKQTHFSKSVESNLNKNHISNDSSPISKLNDEEDIHIAAERFVKRYSVENEENNPESTRLAVSGSLSLDSELDSFTTAITIPTFETWMLHIMVGLMIYLISYQNFQVTVVGHISPLIWFITLAFAYGLGRYQVRSNANHILQQAKRHIQFMDQQMKKMKLSNIRKSDAMKRQSFLCHTASMVTGKTVDNTNEPTAALPEVVDPRLPEGFYSVLQMKDDNIFKCEAKPNIAPFLMKRLLNKPTLGKNADGTEAVPLCHWLGTDYLLTETPEDPIYKNKYLNRVGLRDKPLLIINAVLPWANIVMYYAMPDWVKNFDEMKVNDEDSQEIQCFKKFLMGDDEYRYLRLQFFPCLVDGPMAMKMVAPPKRELIGRTTLMPKFSWYKENETTIVGGRKQCAVLEGSVDLSQSALCRSLSRIMRRNISTFSMDVAWIIDQPEFQKEYEPACFVGILKLDHIDLTDAPILPPESEEDDVQNASLVASQLMSQ